MIEPNQQARMAALWMMHCHSLARLLRAHGRRRHADNLEAVIQELSDIISGEVGAPALRDALDWASNEFWSVEDAPVPASSPH